MSEDKLPIGYVHNTEHIVTVANELERLIDELLEKTRDESFWRDRALPSRIEEAKAIKDLAGALYSLVRTR